jgi:hypothetical protein
LREPRTRHQGVLPHHPHPQPFIFYALAALLCARTRSEKLPSDFIEKLPASITKIARDAFEDTPLHDQCAAQNKQYVLDDDGKATFKEGVETIERAMEEDMEQIREVIIPEGAKTIAKSAFGADDDNEEGCVNLASISLPTSLEEVGSRAFYM